MHQSTTSVSRQLEFFNWWYGHWKENRKFRIPLQNSFIQPIMTKLSLGTGQLLDAIDPGMNWSEHVPAIRQNQRITPQVYDDTGLGGESNIWKQDLDYKTNKQKMCKYFPIIIFWNS